jgi:hypothetical protein
MVVPLPFNHGLPVGYATSEKITGEKLIERWNIFAGAGENSHQWIDTPFFHRWDEVMANGGKKLALCWGQSGTNNTEHQTSQRPCPLWKTDLSCFWKLWLEALERGFQGDQDQAWNEFTAQAMDSIPEDVRDNRDILSITDLLALTDSTPPQ